jgi:RimJ/RimL family protein N-acetyltransferase
MDTVEFVQAHMAGKFENVDHIRWTTIWLSDQIIGHVDERHLRIGRAKVALCGWNLHPDFWGLGVMPEALSRIIAARFLTQEVASFSADCFDDNFRCIKMLSKLGFTQTQLGRWERLRLAFAHSCWRPLTRFTFSEAQWTLMNKPDNHEMRRSRKRRAGSD